MKDRTNFIMVVLAIVLVVGAIMLNNTFNNTYNNPEETVHFGNWTNDKILDSIQVYDAQGNACQLSDYYGKPLVLLYWGLWQENSQQSLDSFLQAAQAHGDKAQFVLLVRPETLEDNLSASQAYLQDKNLETVLYDRDCQTLLRLELDDGPLTFFVNTQGECNLFGQGPLTQEEFVTGLEDIKL